MKVQLIGKNKKGFVTLEIMIAFAVVILCMGAVIIVAFGNQSVAVDLETNNEAIFRAQALLEKARADSRFDFNLVNPILPHSDPGSIYTESLDVTQKDFFTKKVTSTVSWQAAGRNLFTTFSTLLTNPHSDDTCSSVLSGDWKNPQIESTINFSSLSGIPAGTYTITDVDAHDGKLYVTISSTTQKTDPTFFVFNINDPSNPVLSGKVDNDTAVKAGLNAVTVHDKYAFVASASSYARGQMQVIELDSMSVVNTFKVPVIDPSGSSNGSGNSIFYKNGIIYLGLTKSTSENEFNIIDVSNPSPAQIGKYPIGNAVNRMVVRDNYAYIVSPNADELQILDISNLDTPISSGSFNSTSGAGHGKSIYLVGDKLYLGKTTGAGFDFHILRDSDPTKVLLELGGIDVANSINSIVTKDYLSFLLTNNDLQIFNTSNPSNITPWGTFTLPGSYDSSQPEPSMDCEGNRIFISSNNDGGQGSIYIIKPGP